MEITTSFKKPAFTCIIIATSSFAQVCLLLRNVSQVSDVAHGPLDLTVANCCLSSLCFFVRLGNFLFFQFKIFPIFSFKVKQSDTVGARHLV